MAAGVRMEIGGSANLIRKVPRTTGSVAQRNRKIYRGTLIMGESPKQVAESAKNLGPHF